MKQTFTFFFLLISFFASAQYKLKNDGNHLYFSQDIGLLGKSKDNIYDNLIRSIYTTYKNSAAKIKEDRGSGVIVYSASCNYKYGLMNEVKVFYTISFKIDDGKYSVLATDFYGRKRNTSIPEIDFNKEFDLLFHHSDTKNRNARIKRFDLFKVAVISDLINIEKIASDSL